MEWTNKNANKNATAPSFGSYNEIRSGQDGSLHSFNQSQLT
jgi:hypothetical protein